MRIESDPQRGAKRFSPSFETRKRARLIVAEIKAKLEKWQNDAAFAVALSHKATAPIILRWLTTVERALDEIEQEESCLKGLLATAPIEVERDSQVVDVRRAIRQVQTRLMAAKSNLTQIVRRPST